MRKNAQTPGLEQRTYLYRRHSVPVHLLHWLNSIFPGWVDVFGGRTPARTIHFEERFDG